MIYKKAIIPAIKSKVFLPPVRLETTVLKKVLPLKTPHISTQHEKETHMVNIIPFDTDDIHNISDEDEDDITAQIQKMTTTVEMPFPIYMSSDPFEDAIEVSINTKGHHPSMGLILTTNTSMGHRPQLKECLKSTPADQIPKWRSTLRGSFPTETDAQKIITLQDVDKAVRKSM